MPLIQSDSFETLARNTLLAIQAGAIPAQAIQPMPLQ